MDPKALRGWMLCQPRPVKLRIVCGDEAPHVLEVQSGMSFANIAKSVVALEPERVEALDKSGQLIRVYTSDDDEDEPEEEEADFVVPTDGESQRFIIVAKLLGDAYKHSTSVAFEKLGELFRTVSDREQSQARSLEAMQKIVMKQTIEAAAEGDAPEGSFEQMMISSVLQGMAKKQAEEAAAKHVNGAANGTPKGEA